MQLNPYLMFNGQCAEAVRFYERTLGANVESVLLAEATPAASQMPAEFRKKVMHAPIRVNGQTIMASDCPPDRYAPPRGFSLTVSYEDAIEAERVFAALAEGGRVEMPIQETFWAVRFGMLADRYGTPWMVNCEKVRIELEKVPECTAAVE